MTEGHADSRAVAKYSVELSPVAETLLIPVAARAYDASRAKPILGDELATQVMQQLDYDFEKVQLSHIEGLCIAIRTRIFDDWTDAFLKRHSASMVISLGCGLDARAQRLTWARRTKWFDIDLPEVVSIRSQIMKTEFKGLDYQLIGADITSEEWLTTLPRNQPAVIILEGVLSYLPEIDRQKLLQRLAAHFSDGEILLDCVNSMILKREETHPLQSARRPKAKFKSAVDDLEQLSNSHDTLQVVEAINFVEAPGIARLPMLTRLKMYFASCIPTGRDAVRLVRLGIGPSTFSPAESTLHADYQIG